MRALDIEKAAALLKRKLHIEELMNIVKKDNTSHVRFFLGNSYLDVTKHDINEFLLAQHKTTKEEILALGVQL